ncbi:hypothetical protein DAI22_06g200900 [Oryza sativa Japonica Group]|nr:hypothetical protein DAI22_06g200900 [Oryza sativa Japonica Group]
MSIYSQHQRVRIPLTRHLNLFSTPFCGDHVCSCIHTLANQLMVRLRGIRRDDPIPIMGWESLL